MNANNEKKVVSKPPQFKLESEFPGAIWYDEEEIIAVTNVIKCQSPFRYYGPQCNFEVKNFESEFARFLASTPNKPWPDKSEFYVTAVNSGTGALEVALDALGVGCGDEVIVSGFMWIATISAIIRNRAIPVLIDSDDTLGIDPDDIKNRVTDRTKVIIPVPMLGGCTRIGRIMEVVRVINAARKKKKLPPILVLEDNAQSMGAFATGTPGSVQPIGENGIHRIGIFGDIAIFRLQINKNITAGEGGIIVTRDPELHRRVEALHNVGYARENNACVNWYGDNPLGWGQGRRMSELQGAIGRIQLKKVDKIISNMRSSHKRLEDKIKEMGLIPRARADPKDPGDIGYYLIFKFPCEGLTEDQKIQKGRAIAATLNEYKLHAWFLHDFEVHVYYNIQPLVNKIPMNNGCPWNCVKNQFHTNYSYH